MKIILTIGNDDLKLESKVLDVKSCKAYKIPLMQAGEGFVYLVFKRTRRYRSPHELNERIYEFSLSGIETKLTYKVYCNEELVAKFKERDSANYFVIKMLSHNTGDKYCIRPEA